MKKFVYKNKKTGKKILSDVKLADKDLICVSVTMDTSMKSKTNVICKKCTQQ